MTSNRNVLVSIRFFGIVNLILCFIKQISFTWLDLLNIIFPIIEISKVKISCFICLHRCKKCTCICRCSGTVKIRPRSRCDVIVSGIGYDSSAIRIIHRFQCIQSIGCTGKSGISLWIRSFFVFLINGYITANGCIGHFHRIE